MEGIYICFKKTNFKNDCKISKLGAKKSQKGKTLLCKSENELSPFVWYCMILQETRRNINVKCKINCIFSA